MQTIEKKILPKYFQDVISGSKTFELRKDEDGIQVGDIIILKEWNGEKYTGNELNAVVTYVLRDVPQYGLADGYCVIGLLSNMKYVYYKGIDDAIHIIEQMQEVAEANMMWVCVDVCERILKQIEQLKAGGKNE